MKKVLTDKRLSDILFLVMKNEFIIIGIEGITGYVWSGHDFVTTPWEDAKRFKTRSGANRSIDRLLDLGHKLQMASISAPPSAASTLGKLSAGKSKNFSAEELALRSERMAAARRKRWAK